MALREVKTLIRDRLAQQAYRVITDSAALDQLAALPTSTLSYYAETLGVLELTPANGRPLQRRQPGRANA